MRVINAENVNDAFWKQTELFHKYGVTEETRNGTVSRIPGPVTTIYEKPRERVLFSAVRDANPFFHLIEALWMLAGRNDVAVPSFFVRRFHGFSDNGVNLHGAYGRRWRGHFGEDQLARVIQLLKNHPDSRRAVIQMYDATRDQYTNENSKDIPCNLTIHVELNHGKLDLTVFCRSNDAIWGATGANAVHFPVLQEYHAAGIGAEVGKFYQISNNLHMYVNNTPDEPIITFEGWYDTDRVKPDIIVKHFDSFDKELLQFFAMWTSENSVSSHIQIEHQKWGNPIFPSVAIPMVQAYFIFRRGKDVKRYPEMLKILKSEGSTAEKSDWLWAAREWVERRQVAFERAKDNGVNYDQ